MPKEYQKMEQMEKEMHGKPSKEMKMKLAVAILKKKAKKIK